MTPKKDGDQQDDKGARPISVENHEPAEKTHQPDKHHEKSADPIVTENDDSGS